MNVFTTPDALFCFKIGGAVLAGLGAGIKVFKEMVKKRKEKLRNVQTADSDYPDNLVAPNDPEEPHNLFWETIELSFIIGGLIVNMAATAIDQKQTIARNEKNATETFKQLQKTDQQITLATEALANLGTNIDLTLKSLNYLERLGTRFDTVSFSLTCILTTNYPGFTLLSHYMSTAYTTDPSAQTNALQNSVNSANIVGYKTKMVGKNTQTFTFSSRNSTLTEVSSDFSDDDILACFASQSTNLEIFDSLEFICKPEICFRMFANTTYNYYLDKADLALNATKLTAKPHLKFIPSTKKLSVEWVFDCPKTNWEQISWLSSIPDIANATLFLGLTNNLQNGVVPFSAIFTFDRIPIPVTKLDPCNLEKWYVCVFPSKEQILRMR